VCQGEHQIIVDYVQENPRAKYQEIIKHLLEAVPDRLTRHLDDIEGDTLVIRDDGYHVREEASLDGRRSE
jgi:hypothetical protein